MLWQILNKVSQAGLVFLRTIRAFFYRRISAVLAKFRQMTNLTRGATKVATTSIQSAAAATQKPTKREDYVDAGGLLVAKSFLLKLIIGIVIVILLVYFIIWPFILSHFLTAKFFVEDKRIENWTGRVIVYSDKKKTIPLYEGKLEEGKLEDQGKEYDKNGILSYEGTFLHGKRSGQGTSYRNGVISYKGEFDAGVPSGTGTSYDKEGDMVVQGEFADGLPEGTGKEYKKGTLLYQGGFSAGKHNGKGTLYLSPTEQLDATFQDGEPDGVVTWSKSGKTYYQGDWADGKPEGFGTLFGKSGKKLYQGQLLGGTLDGPWLLGLTLDELKEALGDAQTTSTQENAQSFLLSSPELGLVARCSYQTETSDSQVYSIYLSRPRGETWFQLLPGEDHVSLQTKGQVTNRKTGPLQFNTPKGVEVKSGSYDSTMLYTDDTRTTLLRYEAGGAPALLTWSRLESIPVSALMSGSGAGGGSTGAGGGGAAGAAGAAGGAGGAGSAGGGSSSEEKMEAFLDALDGMQGAGGAEAVPNDYCGDTSPADALKACKSPEQISSLVDAMTDYWLQSETQAGLEENLRRVQGQLDDANAGKNMGSGGSTKALEQSKVTLEGQIESCQNQRAKAQVAAKEAAGVDPAKFAAGDILVQFDPATLDVSSLVPTAAAYAQATGGNPDPAALELQIKTLLVDLKDSYGRIQSAVESCRLAAEQSKSAASSFAMGTSDKSGWFTAMSGETDAKLELFAATAAFTKQANTLNTLTGGWVSRTCGWFTQEMGPVFEDAMQAAPSETPEAAQESAVGDEKEERYG